MSATRNALAPCNATGQLKHGARDIDSLGQLSRCFSLFLSGMSGIGSPILKLEMPYDLLGHFLFI